MNEQSEQRYYELLTAGPFAGLVDPWAEMARYFHQIHNGMLSQILSQIAFPLLNMGYLVSREASLQIASGRRPDVAVQTSTYAPKQPLSGILDYFATATQFAQVLGIEVEDEEMELQSIHISHDHDLVTVIELISPRNKHSANDIHLYRDRRQSLFLDQGVHVVELDTTRSALRLFDHPLTLKTAYHGVIFLAANEHNPRPQKWVFPMNLLAPLDSFLVPLLDTGIVVDWQQAYQNAYQEVIIAAQIENKRHYVMDTLPFAHLLSDVQRHLLLEKVQQWHESLHAAKNNQESS